MLDGIGARGGGGGGGDGAEGVGQLFEAVGEEELKDDACYKLIFESSEEASKVSRNQVRPLSPTHSASDGLHARRGRRRWPAGVHSHLLPTQKYVAEVSPQPPAALPGLNSARRPRSLAQPGAPRRLPLIQAGRVRRQMRLSPIQGGRPRALATR